jgi:16S rRNA (cytosine967-C5)-methyltransferase
LIYVVCSLQRDEGLERIDRALARGGLCHAPFLRAELPGLPDAITPEGFLRTHPGMWSTHGGIDGFFAARLIRT